MTMKKCCEEMFKRTIEEVLFTIRDSAKPKTVEEVIKGLEYAVSLLEKKEK